MLKQQLRNRKSKILCSINFDYFLNNFILSKKSIIILFSLNSGAHSQSTSPTNIINSIKYIKNEKIHVFLALKSEKSHYIEINE